MAYDANTHQHIDRTFDSQCLRAHGVRGGRLGQLGCSGQLGGEQAVPSVHAATARLLESEDQVDESGEVDARGSAIMESGRATAAGITNRPRIWSRSSKVALAHARQRRGGIPSARAARPAVCRTLAECIGATPKPAAFVTSGNAARLQALPVQLAASMQECGRVTRANGRAARLPPK